MRVDFNITVGSASADRIEANKAHAASLGLPYVAGLAGGGALNVIGRAPSVADHAEFLRRDDAVNWAAGTAWAWCRDNGIRAAFVCVDAQPRMADYVAGCDVAILHPQCDPALFAALVGADVKLVAPEHEEYGSTSATQAAFLGAVMGYQVRLFGCDGSYAQTTHVNEDVPQENEMYVRAAGKVFRTNTQMLVQSEQFARVICACRPGVFSDYSGGLLSALIESCGEWDMVRWDNAPPQIAAHLNTGNPGWGDDGASDWSARAAQ